MLNNFYYNVYIHNMCVYIILIFYKHFYFKMELYNYNNIITKN